MKGAKISHTDYIPLPLREPVMMDDRQEDIHDTTLVDDPPQGQSGGGIEARKYRHSGGSHYEKYQQGHHMQPLPAQIYDRYVDAGTMERSPSWKRSFKQHEYPADYEMGTRINMDESQNFKIPSFKQDNPVATIIHRRNASSQKRSTIRKREREDINEYVDVEDNHMLPSIQIQRRERHKTLRERRSTKRAEIPVGEDDLDRTKSFRERYAETKEKHDLTARNFAVLLRDTASAKLADWRRPKKWDILTKRIREFFQHFSIWSSHMRIIEGRFGTAIMSYFRFLRWLMFLNAYIMIIQFFCITVPYLALGPRTFSLTVPPNASNFTRTADKCTQDYTIYHEDNLRNETAFQKFLDFLLGTGWMERTVLFYGEYFNKTYYMPDGEKTYDMGLAYLLSAGVSFVISFILIVKNSSKAIKGTFGMERSVAMYCNRVFCSWDYCISNKKAAKVKKKNLLIDFRESLEEQRKTWEKVEESKIRLFGIRVAINLFILGILIGALYLVYYTTDRLLELQKQKLDDIVAFIVQYVPTVTITILNFVIPIVFQKIVILEKYSSRVEINVTLARSVILRLASLVVLIGTLYRLLIIEHTGILDCGNTKWGDSNVTTKGNIKCWETYVGQQIYKLVLLDLIVETGIILIVQFPRRLIYDKYQKKHKLVQKLGPNQFDLAQNVIDIVYTQTIGWFGMFFSPLIPFMTFVKCFIFFYVRKWTLLSNCAPAEKTNVTSRSNSLFMMVLLLSFIFVTVPIGYMVGYISPSQSCGPFRVYSENKTHVMFDTISLTIESWPSTARDIFFFFGTVGFLVPVMILLILLMYYFWLLGQGYKKREKLLKNQLKLEGQDKKFLLTQVNAILMQTDAGSTG